MLKKDGARNGQHEQADVLCILPSLRAVISSLGGALMSLRGPIRVSALICGLTPRKKKLVPLRADRPPSHWYIRIQSVAS